MSVSLAFKVAGDSFLDQTIKERTGGRFSHVELWLRGEGKAAECFSSRSGGTAFATIDITDPKIWWVQPVPYPLEFEGELYWFCRGNCDRAYDAIGLVGIGWDIPTVHDPYDRFCSEACFEALQGPRNLFPGIGPRWMVAPSGHPKGGFGLYELIQGLKGN